MDILVGLNPKQKEAVEAINGPVLILAGPGSGKTRVIVHRIAYLVKELKVVSPHRILATTFTNKAAREMMERVRQLLGHSAEQLTMGTFHSLCARFLRQSGKAIGVDPRFVIYDSDDQTSLIKRSLQEVGLDPKQFAPAAICSVISASKSQILTPKDYSQRARSYFDEVVSRVYERYQELLAQSNALDFDDLLMKTAQLFRSSPETLSQYQNRYLHVMVDEFQDTNLVQYELMKKLAGKYRNICVVGDPDQSIYSWRFADLRNILNFEKDYPDAKVVLLEQNYRSTKLILEAASHVISANRQRKQKGLWTENESGEALRIVETYSEGEEAQFVVGEIDKLVSGSKAKPGDFAIMYRTNAQSRALEEAFIRYGMQYKLVAGTRFYERREVKDIIAYMRLIQNVNDSVSLQRIINVPGRGIGQKTTTELTRWAKSMDLPEYRALQLISETGNDADKKTPFNPRTSQMLAGFLKIVEGLVEKSHELSLLELLDLVIQKTGYKEYTMSQPDGEERWDNIMELRTVAKQYNELPPRDGLAAFLEGVALVSDVDSLDETVDVVTLITLHQAKGLEFPIVFIVGTEDGILPHSRSFDDPAQMEEERRLFYVGITRAQRKVYLVRAFRRALMGSSTARLPSRFLKDIPLHLTSGDGSWQGQDSHVASAVYSWNRPPAVAPEAKPRVAKAELSAGDHVRHAIFGSGLVVSLKPAKDDSEVVVVFDGVGLKKLSLNFAQLEKVT